MASYPARILLDAFSIITLMHFAAIVVGFFFIVHWYWKIGLKAYSSASS
jgi:ABC-type uncharacterized transport system permease subunit